MEVDPVGAVEIAERLGVKRQTVDQWRQRNRFPEPRWTVGGRPAWNWPDVDEWARATGRGLPSIQDPIQLTPCAASPHGAGNPITRAPRISHHLL